MDGDHRAGESGADDGNIEMLNFLTHGLSGGRNGMGMDDKYLG
jgi:hypothetical protein